MMRSYGVGLDGRRDDVLYDIHDTTIAGNYDDNNRGWINTEGGVISSETTWRRYFRYIV